MTNPSPPTDSRHSAAIGLSAAVVSGFALWISRASFDVAGTTLAPERVAMLPSLAELLGFIVMALLVAAGLASALRGRRGAGPGLWDAAADALLPLFSLSLLTIPYLPWIADWMPPLRLLAGPAKLLIWVVVLGQVLCRALPRLAPSTAAIVFGISAVAASAPLVLNVRNIPDAFPDLIQTAARLPSADWSLAPAGSLGVLFDQEYGIFPFAPVLLLAIPGLAGMAREPSHRRAAIALSIAVLALIVLPGTLNPWWSQSAMPGQLLVLMIPLLMPPIAWLYRRLPERSLSRASAQMLLLVSVAITLSLVLEMVPARQAADGSSAFLHWLSPTWQLWTELPTYIVGTPATATIRVVLWCGLMTAAAWLMRRLTLASEGRAALMATVSATLLFLTFVFATSLTITDGAARFDVERRVSFELLETFDPVARPIAVRYNPFAVVSAGELPALFTASAVPGERTDRQPLRVVLNARFRLPAGKYELGLTASDTGTSVPSAALAVQIGREGRPLESWPLMIGRGEHMRHEFEVPLDAEFVGFRAERQLEATIAELRVSPRGVVETRRRFPAGTILGAAAFPLARVFFHDSHAYPETDGFWVRGGTEVRVTLEKLKDADSGILLAVHSGPRQNVVTLSTPGWSQKLELVPGITQRVTVPFQKGQRFVALGIRTTGGFVPAEVEQSADRRLLGAWLAFIPDDTARTFATP